MIVLNSDKGFVQVENWEDIETRPGFTNNLNPKEHSLSAIIGSYAFTDLIRCGLSNCHTPHNKGYIAVTKEGRETNIGKVCGKNYFGVDFETLRRKFDDDLQEKRDRDTLWSFSFKLDEFKERIHDLRSQPHGADWAYKLLRPLKDGSRNFTGIASIINKMIKSGNPKLTKAREATDAEIDALETATGRHIDRPHVIEEPIATISGLEALYQENDLRNLLVFELEERIKTFESNNIDTLTRSQLRTFAKWAGSTDASFDRAVASLKSARTFLTKQNIAPFANVVTDIHEDGLGLYLRDLPASAVTSSLEATA